MKKTMFILVVMIFGVIGFSHAKPYQYIRPYVKSNGKIVNGYLKTYQNNTKFDNFSTKGNINPFTGKKGTVNPYRVPSVYKPLKF